jgi:hypothetical protein
MSDTKAAVEATPKETKEKEVEAKEKLFKSMNIFQKMSNATVEIATVAKNLNVNLGKSSYKAVGEADVLFAIKPIEFKWGIYSYPFSREIVEASIVENTAQNGEVKKTFVLRLKTVYRFVNVDNASEFIDITSYGDGFDTGDKAPGKAMTYGDKYAVMKAYKIITGDDPDQYPSPTFGKDDKITTEISSEKGVSSNNVKQSALETKNAPSPDSVALEAKRERLSTLKNRYQKIDVLSIYSSVCKNGVPTDEQLDEIEWRSAQKERIRELKAQYNADVEGIIKSAAKEERITEPEWDEIEKKCIFEQQIKEESENDFK